MIFRQLFDSESSTYTYLLASRHGGEALIVDPVLDNVDRYLQLLEDLDLKLVKAVDTHVHADHITGLGALRDQTRCITVMGEQRRCRCCVHAGLRRRHYRCREPVARRDLHTGTHERFLQFPDGRPRVYRGHAADPRDGPDGLPSTGDPRAQYDSIFNKLLKLPDDTLVYPAHDYKGDTVSTIAEERACNPRLQVDSEAAYVEIMENLNLANPKMMDVAVPANLKIGLKQDNLEGLGLSLTCGEGLAQLSDPSLILVDLRDDKERSKEGVIPGSVHAPYPDLDEQVHPGGMLYELARTSGRRVVFYCAYGERSAMAVEAALEAGMSDVCHLSGGMDAWKAAGGPTA